MSTSPRARELADRLAAVEWLEDVRRAPSRAALMSEFLRRSALWAQALGCEDLWPWFDIAEEIEPASRADPALLQQVRDSVNKRGGTPLERRLAEYALHFAALPKTGFDLPDPFEPLIMLWERGGRFRREVGLVYFGAMGVRVGRMADHLSPHPVAKAEPTAMDEADERWQARFPPRVQPPAAAS